MYILILLVAVLAIVVINLMCEEFRKQCVDKFRHEPFSGTILYAHCYAVALVPICWYLHTKAIELGLNSATPMIDRKSVV